MKAVLLLMIVVSMVAISGCTDNRLEYGRDTTHVEPVKEVPKTSGTSTNETIGFPEGNEKEIIDMIGLMVPLIMVAMLISIVLRGRSYD